MSSDFFNEMLSTVPMPPRIASRRSFWRKEDPVLTEKRIVVKGGMWNHQRAWWDLPNFIKGMIGGYGSGKTNILCKRMISLSIQNAPCPVAVVSPTFPIARQTTMLTITELLSGKQTILGKDLFWRYNSTTRTFTIKYRGRTASLLILSGERPLGLRGPNLAAAGIDEPFIQDLDVFTQMIARVRHPQAVKREICLTGTPEQLNWGYDLFEGDLATKHDVAMITASTRANLVMDPGYVERLEGAFTDRAAMAYIEGQFVSLSEGQVYYAFDPNEHMVDLVRPRSAELFAGMDFNVNPMSVALGWRNGNHVHYFEEMEFPNADTEFVCSVLRERYWSAGLRDIYPDATGAKRATNAPAGKSDHHFIREAGFNIRAHHANPLRKDRYNAVNGKFKPRTGRVSLTISPKLKLLKKYLSTYSHELMNKQENMSHLLDAFSYPIAYMFPVDKETLMTMRMSGA